MSVRISIDETNLEAVAERLGEFRNKAPNACASALNRSLTNVSATLKKEVRAKYHVKAGDIAATLKTKRASAAKLSAEVRSSGSPISLEKFKVSPKTINPRRKSQLKIAIKKNGTKQILGAFIANINGIKVFKRVAKPRLPIEKLFGPSVPQMAGEDSIVDNINTKAAQTYEQRLGHEINRLLARLGG